MWIETLIDSYIKLQDSVTPHVGVWIETIPILSNSGIGRVTPHVGVWIETPTEISYCFTITSHLM